ncbi:Transcription initiation factor IIA subunit 2 [Abeliophyllum distichum]|uniref:Transcription initiation factor IIA subunit 2 n=1 Tax=Abeliophyllum distichum TaxID=126358 RepID=A0ABD1RC39_9LAMI
MFLYSERSRTQNREKGSLKLHIPASTHAPSLPFHPPFSLNYYQLDIFEMSSWLDIVIIRNTLVNFYLLFFGFHSSTLGVKRIWIWIMQGHLHTHRFCDNVWTFILQDAQLKSEDFQENIGHVKIVAYDSKLLTQ